MATGLTMGEATMKALEGIHDFRSKTDFLRLGRQRYMVLTRALFFFSIDKRESRAAE